jgi:hypothetical protein
LDRTRSRLPALEPFRPPLQIDGKEKRNTMTTEERGPGLEGQKSGEGGIRPADAAVATGKEPYGQPGGELTNLSALDAETAATLVGMTRRCTRTTASPTNTTSAWWPAWTRKPPWTRR